MRLGRPQELKSTAKIQSNFCKQAMKHWKEKFEKARLFTTVLNRWDDLELSLGQYSQTQSEQKTCLGKISALLPFSFIQTVLFLFFEGRHLWGSWESLVNNVKQKKQRFRETSLVFKNLLPNGLAVSLLDIYAREMKACIHI